MPRRLLAAAGCVLVVAPSALADGTVRLEPGRAVGTALVAMGLDGRAAALYPRASGVRMVVAAPDATGAVAGGSSEKVPVARGTVIEGLGIDATGRSLVLVRAGYDCSPVSLMVRDPAGAWSTIALGGAPARQAALGIDPAGAPGVLSVGCAGEIALRRPDAAGTWVAEAVPGTVDRVAHAAVALGAAGTAVVGVGGGNPIFEVRSGDGAWSAAPLPDRPLFPGEAITSIRLAFDASGAPVAATTRAGPPAQGISGTAALTVSRRLDRLVGGAWGPLPLPAAGPEPVDVAGMGDTLVARRRDGSLVVQHGGLLSAVPVNAIAAAAGPGGRMAYVPRGAPSVLGVGPPPRMTITAPRGVRFGEAAAFGVKLSMQSSLPVAGARVRVNGVSGITNAQGRVDLHPVLTRTGPVEVLASEPGPVAPVRAVVRIVVRPQPVALRVRLDTRGPRPVVRGSATGGARLPGRLGRVYLLDLSSPGRGFLPAAMLASAPGGRAFGFVATTRRGALLAIFYKGALLRLRTTGANR